MMDPFPISRVSDNTWLSVTRSSLPPLLRSHYVPKYFLLLLPRNTQNTFFLPKLNSSEYQTTESREEPIEIFNSKKMSGTTTEDVKEQELAKPNPEVEGEGKVVDNEDIEHPVENPVPSVQEEEAVIKKKYGGMLPRKPPLISKDHERAFFDSADWALGKQGAPVGKPKGPLEALRPKLQPSHNQSRSRRSAYAPADNEDDGGNNSGNSED